MAAPIYERLIQYHAQSRISFAMPGHKNGAGLRKNLIDCDVTELYKTEDLNHPTENVKKAHSLLAKRYGAKRSYILTGGSTGAVQAMLVAVLNRGDTLLCFSDCHMSVVNTCALLGYKIKMLCRDTDTQFGIPCGTPDIEEQLDGVKAVLATSPNYYGITCDVKKLSEVCLTRDVPLLIDEAHGAHFVVSDMLPETAVMQGADLVCQSAHKTLNALTGAAYLHVNGNRINVERLERALTMLRSSSPSYVIAASADAAREDIETEKKWEAIISICRTFGFNIQAKTKLRLLKNDDYTRLVLNMNEYDITGFETEKILADKYGIDIEAADYKNIVMIVTPSNTNGDMDALFNALVEIFSCMSMKKSKIIVPPRMKTEVINPQAALFGETQSVPLGEAAGRISAVAAAAYPPGVPVIFPGGIISKDAVKYIEDVMRSGGRVVGAGEKIEVIK